MMKRRTLLQTACGVVVAFLFPRDVKSEQSEDCIRFPDITEDLEEAIRIASRRDRFKTLPSGVVAGIGARIRGGGWEMTGCVSIPRGEFYAARSIHIPERILFHGSHPLNGVNGTTIHMPVNSDLLLDFNSRIKYLDVIHGEWGEKWDYHCESDVWGRIPLLPSRRNERLG